MAAAVLSRKETAGERAPDQDTDVVVLGEGLELVFETPADEAVVHLRRDVFLQPQALLQHNRGGRLPGHEVGEADVADLPLAHHVVERPQRLLERRVAVPSVHLVQVDVVGLQPFEAALHFAHDVHARRAAPVEVFAHGQPHLGGQDDLLPHAPQGVAEQGLALPEAVHVGRVDEVDAPVQGELHHSRCVLLAEVAHVHLAAELHGSQRHLAHDESCVPQFPVLHLPYSFRCERKLR